MEYMLRHKTECCTIQKMTKKSLKISNLLMKNLSDGEIWIKELKETQKSLKKMYIDKNDK